MPFLEGHFYLFTKHGDVVLTSISPAFEAGSFDRLLALGEVDNSYILSVVLCPTCGKYQIEIEVCEM